MITHESRIDSPVGTNPDGGNGIYAKDQFGSCTCRTANRPASRGGFMLSAFLVAALLVRRKRKTA